jgi:hypothetical protein
VRLVFISVIAFVACAFIAPRAARAGDDAAVTATASCEKLAAPGRLRCDVEVRAAAGREVRWSDVEVKSAAPFLLPLKGRIGPGDATSKDRDVWRFAFAVVAREAGEGDVILRARAVTCVEKRCAPSQADVVAHVVVTKP